MSEELKPELAPIEENENQNEPLPLEEQVSLELVKHNYTEAKLQEFEEYLKLDIVDDDKEAYLLIKDKRKEVKSYRVAVEKFCKFKREDAVKIQKAWVSKENELVEKISKVEDYLESKEKAYEKKIAEEKEARKRKQEEQLILRQQKLTAMGALYSDGNFTLGDVSFEFSAIKESEEDIWNETIYPRFHEEYLKIQAEELLKEQQRKEAEAELKRQQEEMERKRKELEEKEAELKLEADRQADEKRKAREAKQNARIDQLVALGLKFDFVDHYKGYGCFVPILDIQCHDDEKWNKLIEGVTAQVDRKKAEEAEEKRKEQERKELQNKRYAELLPLKEYGDPVDMDALWDIPEPIYQVMLDVKKMVREKAEEERAQKIADDAAKKERERIEEEQRQAEAKRIKEVGEFRMRMLKNYNGGEGSTVEGLGKMDDTSWEIIRAGCQDAYEALVKKQEEERKAEELARATEKVKWASIVSQLSAIEIPKFVSGQYAKKAAILREKLEEIKAL